MCMQLLTIWMVSVIFINNKKAAERRTAAGQWSGEGWRQEERWNKRGGGGVFRAPRGPGTRRRPPCGGSRARARGGSPAQPGCSRSWRRWRRARRGTRGCPARAACSPPSRSWGPRRGWRTPRRASAAAAGWVRGWPGGRGWGAGVAAGWACPCQSRGSTAAAAAPPPPPPPPPSDTHRDPGLRPPRVPSPGWRVASPPWAGPSYTPPAHMIIVKFSVVSRNLVVYIYLLFFKDFIKSFTKILTQHLLRKKEWKYNIDYHSIYSKDGCIFC